MFEMQDTLFLGSAGITASVKKYIEKHVKPVIFVSELPQTGQSTHIYAVIMDEVTRTGYAIVQLFVWNDTTSAWNAVKAYSIDIEPDELMLKENFQFNSTTGVLNIVTE